MPIGRDRDGVTPVTALADRKNAIAAAMSRFAPNMASTRFPPRSMATATARRLRPSICRTWARQDSMADGGPHGAKYPPGSRRTPMSLICSTHLHCDPRSLEGWDATRPPIAAFRAPRPAPATHVRAAAREKGRPGMRTTLPASSKCKAVRAAWSEGAG
jgi:hypothetical protein